MDSSIARLIATITGALIAGVIGIYLAERNRKRGAQDEFHIEMSLLYGESLNVSNHPEFYRATLDRFQKAVFRIRPFLTADQATRLETIWKLYRAIDVSKLHPDNESDFYHELYKVFDEQPPVKPSRLITAYIEQFEKVVMGR